jgi:predicted metal-dependent hydrolase
MTTEEERLTTCEVLPMLDSERNLPTQIHELDEKIEWLQGELANIQTQIADTAVDRNLLIRRAREIPRLDDGVYKIVDIPIYPKKHVDVTVLKERFSDKYDQILSNIRERIKDKINAEMDKAAVSISQADVKAVVRDKFALMQIIPEPTEPERYEVSVVKR